MANVPAVPSLKWCGTTRRISRPKPTTCKPTITAAIPPTRRHSAGVSDALTRALSDGSRNGNDEASMSLSSRARQQPRLAPDETYSPPTG